MSAKQQRREKSVRDSEKIKKTPKKKQSNHREEKKEEDAKSRHVRRNLKSIALIASNSTCNKPEWSKFMDYIQKRAKTFDPNSTTYIDYEQRARDRNAPPARRVGIVIRR
jgi:hypothetical protein